MDGVAVGVERAEPALVKGKRGEIGGVALERPVAPVEGHRVQSRDIHRAILVPSQRVRGEARGHANVRRSERRTAAARPGRR
jgi:hypothetical protein